MSKPAGYFLDSKDGEDELFVCRSCVKEHGKSTDHPVAIDSFTFLPMPCGFHSLNAEPEDYV